VDDAIARGTEWATASASARGAGERATVRRGRNAPATAVRPGRARPAQQRKDAASRS
jgi:hypothetical protein